MHKDTDALPFWPGFRVCELKVQGPEVQIRLEPDPTVPLRCGHCLAQCSRIHEQLTRRVRDLPMVGHPVRLEVVLYRLACASCGQRLQHVAWLARHSRLTRRLEQAAAQACTRMAVAHVAQWLGLHWSTVRALDKQRLLAEVAALPALEPRRLIMDEFALFKGHRYASVILDADSGRVLWVAEGRSRKSVRPFFKELGPQGCARIEAVAMDMNSAFDLEVRHHCASARIVYDLFHVVAKYGREVIDRVRVDEANRLRHDKPARKLIKSARWLLARNPENIARPEDQIRLRDLLAANRTLFKVYVMKDDLKTLWGYRHSGYAERFWRQWYHRAMHSRIAPLKTFARRLKDYLPGILSHCRWPLGTNLVEGINNKIKVIKRMAYGYRDEAYFFLKIRAAFPGVRR